MGGFHINRELLPVKANYFLINGGHSGVQPLLSVYAKQMGIGADVMGYIYAIISCITVLSKPLVGGLVDHFQKLKLVLVSLIVIDIMAGMVLNFIPTPNQTGSSNATNSFLVCLNNSSYIFNSELKTCEVQNAANCQADCMTSCVLCQLNSTICQNSKKVESINDINFGNGEFLYNIPLNCTDAIQEQCDMDGKTPCDENCIRDSVDCADTTEVNPTLQLWMLSIFMAVIYVCYGSIVSLSDAACFNALENKPELYGKQRMWGTIGWGTFALVGGYLNQVLTGNSKIYSYSGGFYMMLALLLVDLTVLPKLKLKEVKTSKNIFKDVGLFVVKPRILFFICQVFFIGVFTGMSRSYLFWYLRTLNASQLLLGLNSVVQCFIGELPFFFFAGWIITKIGHVNTFSMSFIAYGIKFVSYSFLVNPWWGLPLEILQGPCFGSFYSAMTSYAKIVAPVGIEATVQGIASAVFEGMGLATGGLLGGYGFRVFGGRYTLFWAGIISLICGLVNCILNAILICKKPSPE